MKKGTLVKFHWNSGDEDWHHGVTITDADDLGWVLVSAFVPGQVPQPILRFNYATLTLDT